MTDYAVYLSDVFELISRNIFYVTGSFGYVSDFVFV